MTARAFLALAWLPAAAACSDPGVPAKLGDVRDPPNTPCEQSEQCRRFGWCSEKDGECVATSDASCAGSEVCKRGGLCSLEGTRCVAKDGDCGGSDWCSRYDLCTAHEGVCK